ncbi:hypothetical protein C9374_001058 [Naegleria lovaniensis]|uniref:Protein kinase domain-containing protein n=1 Tax=Naegleria lovaniensis TaxID=51637 RepID=A0AA88KN59_NAELO|nr:uncharacterized protein C9374_001058 [Naegleria lovaniensis]KAG2388208.1 hypothetical protein C9374_001058 [Naegleria lovaniensis]
MENYYVIKILGRGSEGQVVLAEHKKTQEQIAIKRMEWASYEDANIHLNEAQKLRDLSHKNIIKYLSVFLHQYSKKAETLYVCLCLEYCPGGDLQQLITSTIKKGKMKEEAIVNYAEQIAEGLRYLHEHNIIHRDLKPQNILIASDGVLKIGDFGISREISTHSIPKTQCGTLEYMSYEMLNKEPYDQLTDMYSYGVILFQMMIGKSIMFSMELRKNPNLFMDLEHQCIEDLGYSRDLFQLAKSLVSYDTRERPSAEQCLKKLNRLKAHSSKHHGKLNLVLQDFKALTNDLKLRVFAFLHIEDMYHMGLTCMEFYNLWEQHWWKLLITSTKLGKEITKSLLQESQGVGSSSPTCSSSRRKRSGSAKSSHSDLSNVHNTNSSSIMNTTIRALNLSITSSSSVHNSLEINIFKQQVFNYVKFQKPKKRRDMNKRGRNVVSEIHPSQIDEAALFMARSLMFGFSSLSNDEELSQRNDHQNNNSKVFMNSRVEQQQQQQQPPLNTLIQKRKNNIEGHVSSSPISMDSPQSNSSSSSTATTTITEKSSSLEDTRDLKHDLKKIPPHTRHDVSHASSRSFMSSLHPLLKYIFNISHPLEFSEEEKDGKNYRDHVESKISKEAILFLCKLVIKYGCKYGRVYVNVKFPVDAQPKEIQALSIWQDPYNTKGIGFWRMLKLGIVKAPKSLGLKSIYRSIKAAECMENIHSQLMPIHEKPHWTLLALLVSPLERKKGLGSEVLMPILRASDEATLPIFTILYHHQEEEPCTHEKVIKELSENRDRTNKKYNQERDALSVVSYGGASDVEAH